MAALEVTPEDPAHRDWRSALPVLANHRVVVRELQRADAVPLHRIVSSPDVARHMWPPPPTTGALERFIEWTWAERAAGRYVCFGIVPDGAAEVAGLLELRQLQPGFFRAELGFFLDPPFWGTGVFSDAARLLVRFAIDVLNVHRIEARASVLNERSNAALQKLGARHEGLLRAAFVGDGNYEDQNLWAIVAGIDVVTEGRDHGRRQPQRQFQRW